MTFSNHSERRKHDRFQVKPGAFAVFKSKTDTPCRIIDISEGGLSFCYINGRDHLDASYELEIFHGDDDFRLGSIPFETVFECVLLQDLLPSGKPLHMRSVKFGSLTPKQRYQLAYFLEANTKSDLTPVD